MIKEEDFKYCKLNEASKGVFPTYFLLDLELTDEQKTRFKKLLTFLGDIAQRHTPPPPPSPCPTCGHVKIIPYADTWHPSEAIHLRNEISLLKKLLEPNRWEGDHT